MPSERFQARTRTDVHSLPVWFLSQSWQGWRRQHFIISFTTSYLNLGELMTRHSVYLCTRHQWLTMNVCSIQHYDSHAEWKRSVMRKQTSGKGFLSDDSGVVTFARRVRGQRSDLPAPSGTPTIGSKCPIAVEAVVIYLFFISTSSSFFFLFHAATIWLWHNLGVTAIQVSRKPL